MPEYNLSPYQLKVARMLIIEGLSCTMAAEEYNLRVDGVRDVASVLLYKTDSRKLAQAAYKLTQAGVLDGIAVGDLKRFKRVKQTVYVLEES